MKPTAQLAACGALLLGCSVIQASPVAPVNGIPTLSILWGTEADPDQIAVATDLPLTLDTEGNFFGGSLSYDFSGNPAVQDLITVSYVGGNVDPVITMGVGFVDFGAPSVFSFGVSAPLAPSVTGLANFRLDVTGSFADGAANGGSVALSPLAPLGILEGQLDFLTFASVGPAATFAGLTGTYGTYTLLGTVNCGAGCDDFGLFLSAKGSGGGDAMSFTARFELTPVPVPAAVWLFASAFGVLALVRRRAA